MKTSQQPEIQPNTAVCFYRVSTEKQENDRQYMECKQFCQAFGWNIIAEFEEKVSGAAELKERKELQNMMAYVETQRPQYVVCSELSRIGRSNLTLTIIEKLTSLGICFISKKDGIKTLNEDGTLNTTTQLVIDILNGINKFELETIRYRVKSGLRKTANAGTWCGGSVPYGFDVQDKKLNQNADEVQNVQLMFSKYAEGWGTMKIAVYLNKQGSTSKQGKMWRDTTVYKILANSIYNGRRTWNNTEIQTPQAKIIEDSIFTAVQERLATKQNTTEINKQQKYGYLLAGKIICACGQHFKGQQRSNNYICKTKKYGKGCNIKSIKIDYLENMVTKNLMVNNMVLLNDTSELVNKTANLKTELAVLTEKLKAGKQQQNYLINNMTKIGQQKFDEKYDASTAYAAQLQEQIDSINIKISNSKTYMNTVNVVASELKFKPNIKGIVEAFGKEDINEVISIDKELVQKVIERIDIDNEKAEVLLVNGNTFTINRPAAKK